jgi:hypothetical protein
VHRGRHAPVSVAAATAALPVAASAGSSLSATPATATLTAPTPSQYDGSRWEQEMDGYDDQPWHIAREKLHPADPMTVDDALFEMELVGHDFYLFLDKETGRPSVVYRRKGYDYGIIALAA